MNEESKKAPGLEGATPAQPEAPKKKMLRFREIRVTLPEEVVELLNAIKKPELTLATVISEIIYKEVKAYVAAQKIIEKESQEPVRPAIEMPPEKKIVTVPANATVNPDKVVRI